MRTRDPRRALLVGGFLAAVVALGVTASVLDIRLATSQNVQLVAHLTDEAVPLDEPFADIWDRAPPVAVPLSAQRTAMPFGGGSVPQVTARAIHDSKRVYVLVEWEDGTENTSVAGQQVFRDAAAVQFPMVAGERVPAFCMGQADGQVNIWQWKGDWQALVDAGRAPPPGSAYTDDYPFQDEVLFESPAEAAGNVYAAGGQASPVESLVAGGFGTLTSAAAQPVAGVGRWDDGRWRVLFARDLAGDGETGVALTDTERTSVAFAVWDGARGDRNGQKSVSTFVDFAFSSEALPAAGIDETPLIVFAVAALTIVGGLLALMLALYLRGRRRARAQA